MVFTIRLLAFLMRIVDERLQKYVSIEIYELLLTICVVFTTLLCLLKTIAIHLMLVVWQNKNKLKML